RIAVLADEPDPALIIDGQHADGAVLEVDDAVDAFFAVGAQDLVFAQADPRVLVDEPAGQGRPGVVPFGAAAIGRVDSGHRRNQPLRAAWRVTPMSAGLRATRMPAASSAAILSEALPEPPEMIAPAWPILLPGGAV